MLNANCLGVFVAAISVFLLGGIWYHPKIFGGIWGHEAHMQKREGGHPKSVYLVAFIFSLVSAFAFTFVLGDSPSLEKSLQFGLIVGLGWVGSSFGINYLFAGRSCKMLLVDAGYHVVQFLIFGLIFGLWK